MKRKLGLETLEDRNLQSAGLGLPAVGPLAQANAQTAQMKAAINQNDLIVIPRAATLPPVRSYDWVSGIRINHNETLVRVRRRRNPS